AATVVAVGCRWCGGRARWGSGKASRIASKASQRRPTRGASRASKRSTRRRRASSPRRAAIAVKMLPMLEAEAAERMKAGKADPTQKIGEGRKHDGEAVTQAAKLTGTNRQYVADAPRARGSTYQTALHSLH